MYTQRLQEVRLDIMTPEVVRQKILESSIPLDNILENMFNLTKFSNPMHYHNVVEEMGPQLLRWMRKIDIFDQHNFVRNMSHLFSTLVTAGTKAGEGAVIHLIEGIDSWDRQLVQDIDLCYSIGDELFFVDITTSEKQIEGKKNQMRSIEWCSPPYTTLVLLVPMMKDFVIPTFSGPQSDLFQSEFDLADELISKVRSMNLSQIEGELMRFSDTLRVPRANKAPKCKGLFHQVRPLIVGLAQRNGPNQMKEVLGIINQLSSEAQEYYSLKNFYEANSVKRLFRTSPSLIQSTSLDPWERCSMIDNVWCQMISKAQSGVVVFGDDFGMRGVQVQRLSIDNSLSDMVLIRANQPIIELFDLKANKTPVLELEDMERVNVDICEQLRQPGMKSVYRDVMSLLAKSASDGSEISDLMSQMTEDLSTKAVNNIGFNLLEHHQSLSRSIGVSGKKFKHFKKKGSLKKRWVILSLESVGGTLNVCLCNHIDSKKELKTGSLIVFGEDSGLSEFICVPHIQNQSELITITPAKASWWATLPLKWISYFSMILQSRWANLPKNDLKVSELIPSDIFKMLLLCVNDSKFSQCSEQLRYLMLNSTGMGNHTKPLYDKISWFKPATLPEKLFMARMKKSSFLIEWCKANNSKDLLSLLTRNVLKENYESKIIKGTSWSVVMPFDDDYIPSESYFFNSFYICKALTINRENKLVSECQVIKKQLEARETFESTWIPSEHKGEFEGSKFNPSLYLQALGAAYSCLSMFGSWESVDAHNGFSYVLNTTNISEVMNNRGSVAYSGPSGLSVTKSKEYNQNSKCYQTILDLMRMTYDGIPKSEKHTPSSYQKRKFEYPSQLNTELWPLLVCSLAANMNHVAKMVHKDQIGVREIAVLNAPSRVQCYFVEKFARLVRDSENRKGSYENLIENPKKDDIVTSIYEQSLNSDNIVLYDNADCSTWGPTMMPFSLYLILGTRTSSKPVRDMLRLCLQSFSNKVFKLPDHFYAYALSHQVSSNELVGQTIKSCNTSPYVAMDYQFIRSPEGMFQGILGCSSSVLAADLLRVSSFITRKLQPELNKVVSVSTSDDYARILYYDPSTSQVHKTAMQNVSLHNEIGLRYGIARNLSKSFVSSYYWEFNSIFMCRSGIYKPEIKSVLSYVDYFHDYDMSSSALSALNVSLQFARQEGSLVSAMIIMMCRIFCNLQQHQMLGKFLSDPYSFFRTKLEYGGQIRPNIVKWVGTNTILALVENYGPDIEQSLSNYIEMQPALHGSVYLDQEKELSMVPRASRSRIVNLVQRASRQYRAIREFVEKAPDAYWFEPWMGIRNCMGNILISCHQREAIHDENKPSHLKLTTPHVPKHLKLFLDSTTGDRLSRNDLLGRIGEPYDNKGTSSDMMDIGRLKSQEEAWLATVKNLSPRSITWIPRLSITTTRDLTVGNAMFLQNTMREYIARTASVMNKEIPSVFKLNFLMSCVATKNRFNKLVNSKTRFKISTMTSDKTDNIWLDLFRSSIIDSCRLTWANNYILEEASQVKPISPTMEENLNNIVPSADGIVVDLVQPTRYGQRVKAIDLTSALNRVSHYSGVQDVTNYFSVLFEMSCNGQFDLVLNTMDLLPRSNSNFRSPNGQFLQESSIRGWSEVAYSIHRDKVWIHNVLLKRSNSQKLPNTKLDTYIYREPKPRVRVKITNFEGFLCVMGLDNFVYCVLGHSSSVSLYRTVFECSSDDFYTEEIAKLLKIVGMGTKLSEDFDDQEIDLSELKMPSQESELPADLDDPELEPDFSFILGEQPAGGLDDLSEPDEDDSLGSFSMQSAWSIKSKSLSKGHAWAVESIKRTKIVGRNRNEYRMMLPFRGLSNIYCSDNNYSAIEKLIMDIKTYDETYQEWALNLLAIAVNSSRATRSVYHS